MLARKNSVSTDAAAVFRDKEWFLSTMARKKVDTTMQIKGKQALHFGYYFHLPNGRERPETGVGSISLPPMSPPQPPLRRGVLACQLKG